MTCHLLVLDIDGTLVDSVELHREALRRSIERAPLLHRDTDWSSYRHRTDSGIFAEAYERSFGAAPARSDCEAFERIFESEYDAVNNVPPRLIPGAIELLAQAQSSASWRIVIATGSFRRPAVQKMGSLQCDEPVLLITASEYRSRHEIVSNAVTAGWDELPVNERGMAISVGDGVWDAQIARDIGLPFIGIARECEALPLYRLGAIEVLPDCQGVWPLLSGLLDRQGAATSWRTVPAAVRPSG